MSVFLNLILYTTVWTLFSTCVEISCKENCFYVQFIYTNWTDDRPRFTVNMTFSNQDGIGSTTTINEPVMSPISTLLIVQQGVNERKRIIYNMTTKLCAVQSIFNAVPLFKAVKENMLKQSNYTFSCPLNRGVYVMNNMRINPKNPLLGLLHQSKGNFTVSGSLLEELPNFRTHPLSTYYVYGRIIKKSCGKNE